MTGADNIAHRTLRLAATAVEAGYVALYRYVAAKEAVFVLGFRNQKEAGY